MNRIFLSPPHVGARERQMLLDAFDSNWIAPIGPHVDAFELEFAAKLGLPHAVALSSGTAALHLALLLLGVSDAAEVITSTFTFAATANAVTYVGARPVFIDASAATWNMDPDLLEEELADCARRGKLPKAVIVVDLYGQSADYDPILAACARYEVPVIEDAAEALGATYKGRPAGTLAPLAAFSFNGNKIITTSGGGMLGCAKKEWAERARFLATQAREDASHYEHREVGFNYRLSNLLAALGRAQLEQLEARVEARRTTNAVYRGALEGLPGISFMPIASYGEPSCWLTCITVQPSEFGASREDLRAALDRRGVEARPVWKPMHLQPVFSSCRVRGGAVAGGLFERGLCLPSGSSLTEEDRQLVIHTIREVSNHRG